jgi:hypothetical protein
MNYRLPVALAAALAVSGCMLPLPGLSGSPVKAVTPGSTVTMQTRVAKVQTMTRTFSVAKNPGLNKAAASFKELATALQSAFASSSGVSARRAGAYSVEEAVDSVRAAGMKATYRVTGMADHGDAKLIYDDATGEVTAIEGKDARVTFKFVNNGATRTWEAVIEKSPDGTTGKFQVEVTGGWRANPMFSPPTPQPRPTDFVLAQANEALAIDTETEPDLETGAEAEPGVEAQSGASVTDMPGYTPLPYKWFNNEYPETVETVRVSLDILPKGDASLAFKLAGTFDEPTRVPNSAAQVPSHWKFNARIPKVSFDWESRMSLAASRAKFDASGALTVETDSGQDQFTYVAKADEQARTASFALTNVAAKVTFLLSGTQKDPHAQPSIKSVLLSAEDGSQLGTVALDPNRPRFAVITFTDKSKMDWELYPADMFPEQHAFGPALGGPAPIAN